MLSDRASYERLIEADFNLKYSAPSTPRFLVLLPPSTSASDSITKGKKDAGFFVGEEIERLAWDRGMELVKLDQGIGGENNVIDGVFEHVVEKLGIGEDKLIRGEKQGGGLKAKEGAQVREFINPCKPTTSPSLPLPPLRARRPSIPLGQGCEFGQKVRRTKS
jgi:hypothetical protein